MGPNCNLEIMPQIPRLSNLSAQEAKCGWSKTDAKGSGTDDFTITCHWESIIFNPDVFGFEDLNLFELHMLALIDRRKDSK